MLIKNEKIKDRRNKKEQLINSSLEYYQMIIKDNLFQISFIYDFIKELFIENTIN